MDQGRRQPGIAGLPTGSLANRLSWYSTRAAVHQRGALLNQGRRAPEGGVSSSRAAAHQGGLLNRGRHALEGGHPHSVQPCTRGRPYSSRSAMHQRSALLIQGRRALEGGPTQPGPPCTRGGLLNRGRHALEEGHPHSDSPSTGDWSFPFRSAAHQREQDRQERLSLFFLRFSCWIPPEI